MSRKEFAIANLFTMVLLTLVFVPLAHQQGGGLYDPWLDYNEDGTIAVEDLAATGKAYGTSGDSAKNVTITGHANKLAYSISEQFVAEDGTFFTPWISVDGYSKVSVSFYTTSLSNQYALAAKHSGGFEFRVEAVDNVAFHFFRTYDVPNELIGVYYQDYSGFDSTVWIDVYVIP